MNSWALALLVAGAFAWWCSPQQQRLRSVVPARPLAVVTAGKRWWVRIDARARRTRYTAQRRRAMVDLVEALVGELNAGQAPIQALKFALDAGPVDFHVFAQSIRLGADPLAQCTQLARIPGCEAALSLAACWRVGSSAGSGLSETMAQLAQGLRDDLAVRAEVQSQIAGPQATARFLAALPVVGPVLATALGVNFGQVLFTTSVGRWCLALGLLLDALGLWWVHRITTSAYPAA